MEKLSGIVPASSRFRSPDMSKEKPVRSGAPNFGQPVSTPSTREGVGTVVDNVKETYTRIYGPDGEKARELENVRIARDMSTRFFNRNVEELPEDSVEISEPGWKQASAARPQIEEEVDTPEVTTPQRSLNVRA